MGGFYLMLKSGVDVVAIMEACYVPEKILGQILIISSLFFLYLPVYPSRHKIVHLKKKPNSKRNYSICMNPLKNYSFHFSDKLRNSQMGYYALTYACYKIATPARYQGSLLCKL